VDTTLKALADPTRRTILLLVRDEEQAAGDIAAHFAVSRTAVSQHLTVLKEAGLLDETRVGTRRLYRARPEGLMEVRAFLDSFWSQRLARLKTEVEVAESRARREPPGAPERS
jgi:DNA-binding transcriptional ArsR family regulator